MLSILLYGAECWVPLRKHLKRLNTFHHRCIRTVLGISNREQWEHHITSDMTRVLWGDIETMTTKVTKRRMEWLGHIARMSNHRIPKIALFGWLPRKRPPGGPRRRWKDVVRKDLKSAGISETAWYDTALSRKTWYERYTAGLQQFQQVQHHHMQSTKDVLCVDCGRTFRRQCDKARHKCIGERQRPVCEQRGAVQCHNCSRWFRSMGGLKVHRCNTISSQLPTNSTSTRRQTRQQLSRDLRCEYCDRVFSRPGDKKRHKCLAERSKPVQEQAGSVVCSRCSKWFLSRGGLAVHKCGTVSTGHE